MLTIKNIVIGVSESGDAGCTNGNYDIPVSISLDNGEVVQEYTCRCGAGCSGNFAVNRFAVGMQFPSVDDIIDYGYAD